MFLITEMPFTHFFLKPPFRQPLFFLKPFSSSPSSLTKPPLHTPSPIFQTPPSSWIKHWPLPLNSGSHSQHNAVEKRAPKSKEESGSSAIDRIVLRLRNLGLGSDDEEEEEEERGEEKERYDGDDGGEKLGDLLKREWVRPDMILADEGGEEEEEEGGVLPWEREEREERRRLRRVVEEEGGEGVSPRARKRVVRAPSLAELTVEDGELRRLRKEGMVLRERVSVPKAGVTNAVLEAIHEKWRRNELVRLKFHEILARDMRTAHEIVEVVRYKFVLLIILVC